MHCPLLSWSKYLIDKSAIDAMKDGVIIINTARGEILELGAVLEGLKSGKIRGLATDVLEREEGRFYEDVFARMQEIQKMDPQWKELIEIAKCNSYPSPRFFLTETALTQIAKTVLKYADEAESKFW
ncbi:hypothetical protein NWP96_04485 [Mycoplasmopsis cynos]|nr:hypothetical protein [Mycoplasmopsis cynos]